MSEKENWSRAEVKAIVADYFAMWAKDLLGLAYNKAEHNRDLRHLIPARSRGSVEKKHQNISAVLWHLGCPYIPGYKPLPRYQGLLRAVVEEQLAEAIEINALISERVQQPAPLLVPTSDRKAKLVPAPVKKEVRELLDEESRRRTKFIRRNYLELEAKNSSLGRAGEDYIIEFERERLWRAGKRTLANRIEHVSETRGDHAGFDILSYEISGKERLIEVKTTRFGQLSRFFVSANEVEVSEVNKGNYFLCRLFDFDKQPKFFVLSGSLQTTCNLKPCTFSAVPG